MFGPFGAGLISCGGSAGVQLVELGTCVVTFKFLMSGCVETFAGNGGFFSLCDVRIIFFLPQILFEKAFVIVYET